MATSNLMVSLQAIHVALVQVSVIPAYTYLFQTIIIESVCTQLTSHSYSWNVFLRWTVCNRRHACVFMWGMKCLGIVLRPLTFFLFCFVLFFSSALPLLLSQTLTGNWLFIVATKTPMVSSHFVNSHFVNSHFVNFPLCQFPLCQFPFGQYWQSGNWRSGKLMKWELVKVQFSKNNVMLTI